MAFIKTNDALLKATVENNIDEIVKRKKAYEVVELEEKICQLRHEIALEEAGIQLSDPERTRFECFKYANQQPEITDNKLS